MSGLSSQSTVASKGIYHGLPQLPNIPNGLTAVVTGANGISGAHMIRVLAEDPTRWKKIYALSRRPPSGDWPKQVQHIPLDFLKSPEDIADVLKEHDIKPDYVFFFAYILVTDDNGALQWGDDRLVGKNKLILTNFLSALPLASALPKRIFIQYGQKWYGVHLGATPIPDEETDPRLTIEGNLYYTQHDVLTAFATKHNIAWNAGLPTFIIGAALDSSQSLMFPILVYASVQKYRGKKLEYPSDLGAWLAPQSMSTAVLNSRFYEWSVLSPDTADQMFNITDDCAFTWGKMWPRLAEFFGMEYTGPETEEGVRWTEKKMQAEPPPHGFGEASLMRSRFSFVAWAKDPENIAAWKELAKTHNLRTDEWKDVGSVFGRADFCLHRPYPSIESTTKAKKLGWFGFVDTYESVLSVAREFIAMRVVPDPAKIVPA